MGVSVTTPFAAGVSPVYEAYCPYRGAEGLTEVEFNEKYPDRARPYVIAQFEKGTGLTDQGLTVVQLHEKRSEMPEVFQPGPNTFYNKGTLDESITAENINCQEFEDASARAVTRRRIRMPRWHVCLFRRRRLDDPRYRRKRQLQPRCLLRLYAGGRQYPASADGQRKRAMGRDQRGRHACGQVRAVEGARRVHPRSTWISR